MASLFVDHSSLLLSWTPRYLDDSTISLSLPLMQTGEGADKRTYRLLLPTIITIIIRNIIIIIIKNSSSNNSSSSHNINKKIIIIIIIIAQSKLHV